MNPLNKLSNLGQSIWFDYISRPLIANGELKKLIEEDDIKGVTSNPAIFEKAIAGSSDYDDSIKKLCKTKSLHNKVLYESLAISDIKNAADVMLPVYKSTNKLDGYVSLEVSPHLAHDTDETINEAKRLWQEVSKPNLMIKVPATDEGIPAIKHLIVQGINVNVTLLFSSDYYKKAANAFIEGLACRVKNGDDISSIASVASFFVSRIDSKIDSLISEDLDKASNDALKSCLGQSAIANAKLTFQMQKKIYNSDAWNKLVGLGAQKQRLLWASTGTKNPKYSDVLYVEELVGEQTVNTLPPDTLNAFREHGQAEITIEKNFEQAKNTFNTLTYNDISFKDVTDTLLDVGVLLFQQAFDKILVSLEEKRKLFACEPEMQKKNSSLKDRR